MIIWIDVTNSPHVLFFRPLVGRLRARGHEVVITARDFAQTLELLDDAGLPYEVVGPPHGGAGRLGKARAMARRLRALRRYTKGRRIDVGLSHASHELPLTARSRGIPSTYAFDYEHARVQHTLGCRAATRVVVPDVIPQSRLDALGARGAKLRRYPGLKEEYYLGELDADRDGVARLGVDARRVVVVVRTPPEVSLYHRHDNPVFRSVLERVGRDPDVHAVALPRTPAQRDALRRLGLPSLLVPDRAVDAPSLLSAADLVVSAGGTMNREAVALGVPVYTVFAGRRGAVDEALVRDGRLRELRSADELVLAKRPAQIATTRRDPEVLLDVMLSGLH